MDGAGRAGRAARLAALALALALGAGPAAAAPLPSQADWAGARAVATLPAGQSLGYVEAGEAGAPVLILLHGYTDNSRSWSLVAEHLARGRHLYLLDLRGHGISAAPACCYSLDALVADVVAFMDMKGIARADFAGHSLGSMTAAVLAARHPERVGKLVLASSALALPAEGAAWLEENVSRLTAPIDPESSFMREWYANPTPVDDAFLTAMRRQSAATPLAVWRGVLDALEITDWAALAPRIEAPAMILWGDQDALFPAVAQSALKAALPEAQVRDFPGLGHNMIWERPAEVAAEIDRFLGNGAE